VDPIALAGIAAALAASALALREATAGRSARAAIGLALAALLLRTPPAAHFSLERWDERYHALVAKNALESPLPPMLVARPLREPAPLDWQHAHVWLHKPPLTTWLMAAAMKLAGQNEIALRLPSLLFSSLGVLVTFAIARRFVSARAALAAAAFQTWNGRVILLAAGLRATDHVDTLMTFAIALGVLQAVRAGEALEESRPRAWLEVAGVGAATAAALLTKDAPALIVPAFFGCLLLLRKLPWSVRLGAPAFASVVALALVAPWQIYTAQHFPALAAVMRGRGALYFTTVVDERGGPWYFHFANLPRHFGLLAPIPVALFCIRGFTPAGRALLPLIAWLALVYGAFSLAATKMEAYVFIASPVVFIALGWFVCDALGSGAGTLLRGGRAIVAAGLVVGAFASVLGPDDPFAPTERNPLWAQELRWLGSELAKLPGPKRVVFDVQWPTECMFYTPATCVAGAPSDADLARAEELGFSIAQYGHATDPRVTAIPFDPRTAAARRLAGNLRAAGVHSPLIYNAREAADLEAYLDRFIEHVWVSGDLPEPGRRIARKLATGSTLVVLLAPAESPPDALRGAFPDALFVEDERYGQPAR
jgi:4-amino-4-deoxy-L-arabinose transferase